MADEGTAKVTITGIPLADGEYDLDLTHFTGDEAHTIKQISGVRLNELAGAGEAGDYDLILAFALIALERHGKKIPISVLSGAELGSIILDLGDAGPPEMSGNGSTPNDSPNPSGRTSTSDGDPGENDPSPTGNPGSEITSESDPETSAG